MRSKYKKKINSYKKYLRDKRFWGVMGILLISAFLRFVNYGNRWGLAYDQAQFALVARYAIDTFQIPLLGPFSSGGPFQTGGEWYWIVMMGWIIFPFTILGPWVFLTILTIVAVLVMWYVGKNLINEKFGFLLATLTAVSPIQILQSTNLTNQTPIILFSTLSILFMVLFIKKRNTKFIFLQALSIGIGTSIHIQAVALIPFLVLTYAFFSKNRIKDFIVICLGIAIPWVPVLIADVQNNFYNTRNMIFYYTSSQAQIPYEALGRRWLTFLIQFMPSSWGLIIGGNIILGYLLIVLTAVVGLALLVKRKINAGWWVIFLSFACMVAIVRYTRTPLFDSFLIFLNPFVLLISSWTVYHIAKFSKILGIVVFIIIVIGSLYKVIPMIQSSTNVTATQIEQFKRELVSRYPNSGFSFYDYKFNTRDKSVSLVLSLYRDGLIDSKGEKMGFVIAGPRTNVQQFHEPVVGKLGDYQIYDLKASNSAQIEKDEWALINPENIYNSVQYWYKNK